ncbi:MAG: hypothetical protein K0R49_1590, partial [Burkholderiales bacterium]|nr:hypothetical protein [Burkholderiales bacterium]
MHEQNIKGYSLDFIKNMNDKTYASTHAKINKLKRQRVDYLLDNAEINVTTGEPKNREDSGLYLELDFIS